MHWCSTTKHTSTCCYLFFTLILMCISLSISDYRCKLITWRPGRSSGVAIKALSHQPTNCNYAKHATRIPQHVQGAQLTINIRIRTDRGFTIKKVKEVFYFLFFLRLVLLRRTSFLTTFYGLYFNHHYIAFTNS